MVRVGLAGSLSGVVFKDCMLIVLMMAGAKTFEIYPDESIG